jgi:hypothetical protein
LRRRGLPGGLLPRCLGASGFPTLPLQLGRRLSRCLLAFGLSPRGLDASDFLPSGLLPLGLLLGRRLSRGFLAFSLSPRGLGTSGFLPL